jgi:hypothetical protein
MCMDDDGDDDDDDARDDDDDDDDDDARDECRAMDYSPEQLYRQSSGSTYVYGPGSPQQYYVDLQVWFKTK